MQSPSVNLYAGKNSSMACSFTMPPSLHNPKFLVRQVAKVIWDLTSKSLLFWETIFLKVCNAVLPNCFCSKIVLLARGVSVNDNPNLLNRVQVGAIYGSWDQLDAAFWTHEGFFNCHAPVVRRVLPNHADEWLGGSYTLIFASRCAALSSTKVTHFMKDVPEITNGRWIWARRRLLKGLYYSKLELSNWIIFTSFH